MAVRPTPAQRSMSPATRRRCEADHTPGPIGAVAAARRENRPPEIGGYAALDLGRVAPEIAQTRPSALRVIKNAGHCGWDAAWKQPHGRHRRRRVAGRIPGLTQSLTAPGMPPALAEYHKGWAGSLGFIPTDRPDMWRHFYNYYLNLVRDNDRGLRLLVDAMDELDLWKNTIVVVTADHGEMAGSHWGFRRQGPFAHPL